MNELKVFGLWDDPKGRFKIVDESYEHDKKIHVRGRLVMKPELVHISVKFHAPKSENTSNQNIEGNPKNGQSQGTE